jgi:ABC-type Mn2+/Zn2+ transport system permease subunit
MQWAHEHRKVLRITFLVGLVIALLGPWMFDQIMVPAQYTCSLPNVRLEGDFCGLPLSITWFYFQGGIFSQLSYLVKGIAAGELKLGDAVGQALVNGFLILILFPVLTTALLIWRPETSGRSMFHVIMLGLAAGIVGIMAATSYSREMWLLWGLWLYIALVICMWVVELSLMIRTRKHSRDTVAA